MKNYKVCGEGPHHIDVQHADGTVMKIAKAHLDMKMMAKLAQMPRVEHKDVGGNVGGDPADQGTGGLLSGIASAVQPYLPGQGDAPQAPPAQPGSEMPAPGASAPPPPDPNMTPAADVAAAGAAQPPPAPTPSVDVTPPGSYGGSSSGADNPYAAVSGQMQGDMAELKQANLDKARAEGKTSDDVAKVYADASDKLIKSEADKQTQLSAVRTENQKIMDNIASTKIDPSHYWNSQDTGAKIGLLAGIVVSGFGSGMSGQPNQALAVMQKNIDRDVEAQQANLGSQKTLLEQNLRKYGDIDQATNATRLNLLAVAQGQVNAAAAKNGSAEALAAARAANAQWDLQYGVPLAQSIAKYRAGAQNIANSNPNTGGGYSAGGGGYDLKKLHILQYQTDNGVPTGQSPELLKKAEEEAGMHGGLTQGLNNMSDQFDAMAKHRGSLMTSAPDVLGSYKDEGSKIYDGAQAAAEAEAGRSLGEKPSIGLIAQSKPFLPARGDSDAVLSWKKANFLNLYKKAALDKAGGFAASRQAGTIDPSDQLLNPIQLPKMGN